MAAQIYDVDKVTLTGDVIGRGINAASNRKACAKCGGCVLNDHQHSLKCMNVYAGLFEDKWEPEFHLFYPVRSMSSASSQHNRKFDLEDHSIRGRIAPLAQ